MDSLAYRLFRSVVTVCIIVLAIAFLGQILFDGYFGRAVRDALNAEAQSTTAYTRFLRRAGLVENPEKLAAGWAAVRPGTADFHNLQRWAGFTPAETSGFIAACGRAGAFTRFFDALPGGKRALLAGELGAFELLDQLQDPVRRSTFLERLSQMKSLDAPGGPAGVESLAREWPAFRERLSRAREGYRAVVAAIALRCGDGGLRDALGTAIRERREGAFFSELEGLGLETAPFEVSGIVEGWRHQEDLSWALGFLKDPNLRAAWYVQFQQSLNPLEALESCATAPSRMRWLEQALASRGAEGFDAARFQRVARDQRARTELLSARQRLVNRYGESAHFNEKTLWLIVVSLLVCIVGITNAMLMSVLERFKEIATMKCLGARNQTIAFLFVMESAAMGVAGGIAGLGVGAAIAFCRQVLEFGGRLLSHFPVADALTGAGICLGCSIAIAAVAAIYPAGVASRMAPMDAMRVD